MRTRFRSEDDGWSTEGRKITDPDSLESIRLVLESDGPVILEHWFYRGSCSPERLVFDDYDNLIAYLDENTFAGDAIYVWSFASVCRDDAVLVSGKCPDERGQIPQRGAY